MPEHPNASHLQRAQGETKLLRSRYRPPDTVLKLPNEEDMILPRRTQEEATPAFRKYNPRKVQPKTSKSSSTNKSPFQRPRTVPFTKFLMIGFVLHQAVNLVRSLWRKRRHRRALAGEEDFSDDDSDSLGSVEEDMCPKNELLPAMMRQAMPRPPRKNLAHRRAEAYHNKPRKHTTAKQMRTPASNVKQRPPGMLERMEKANRQQVRATLLGQQRVAEQLQLKYEQPQQKQLTQPSQTAQLPSPASSTVVATSTQPASSNGGVCAAVDVPVVSAVPVKSEGERREQSEGVVRVR